MKTHPVKSDQRYTVTREFCGEKTAQFVIRFCDEWIDKRSTYGAAVLRAVGHKAARENGIIAGITA